MLDWVNFTVAAITFVVCLILAFQIGTWCYYTNRKVTPVAFWVFFMMTGIKIAFAMLALSNIFAMLDGTSSPIWTLPARIILMFMFCGLAIIIGRARPGDLRRTIFGAKESM